MTIRVLLAEDHELTRQGIAFGLKKYEDIEVVGEASNGKEAVELAKKHSPDVILMDIMMPVLNGINATQDIKAVNKDIKVIMLTSYNEKDKVLSAFNSGANAYCMKNVALDNLVNVIRMVMEGSLWMDNSIAGYILEILSAKADSENKPVEKPIDFGLTTREKEILNLISDGLNNKDISEKLFLSLYTVKNHIRSIFQKLSVEDRTQAAIIALKKRII